MAEATEVRPTDERLQRIAPGAVRDEFLPLLRLADDSASQVRSYYQRGDLFVLYGRGAAMGVTLAMPEEDGVVELKAVAVEPALQGQGVGRRMMALVLAELRAVGVRRVIVGTSSAGVGPLAFYQKAGFRLQRIDRDFFTAERGYPEGLAENGIPVRDMVWMDLEL